MAAIIVFSDFGTQENNVYLFAKRNRNTDLENKCKDTKGEGGG